MTAMPWLSGTCRGSENQALAQATGKSERKGTWPMTAVGGNTDNVGNTSKPSSSVTPAAKIGEQGGGGNWGNQPWHAGFDAIGINSCPEKDKSRDPCPGLVDQTR